MGQVILIQVVRSIQDHFLKCWGLDNMDWLKYQTVSTTIIEKVKRFKKIPDHPQKSTLPGGAETL